MSLGDVSRKTTGTIVTGVVGVVVVEAAKRWGAPLLARRTAVIATAWGLRGARAAEAGAESLRLYGADLLAEAREELGETAPPPGAGAGDHGHEH